MAEIVEQRKCLSHIQRSIDEVLKNKRGPALRFGRELKRLLKEAISLYHDFHDGWMCGSLIPRNRILKDRDNQRLLVEAYAGIGQGGWRDEALNYYRLDAGI